MLRGNAPAKIDDKGRLKVPNGFRDLIAAELRPEGLRDAASTGESVASTRCRSGRASRPSWPRCPRRTPRACEFLDRVNYYGQVAEFDARAACSSTRGCASRRRHERRRRRARAVRLPGSVEPRAASSASSRASPSPTTTRGRWRSSASEASGRWPAHVPVLLAEVRRALGPERGRPVRRLHARARRSHAGAARGRRQPRDRDRPRPLGARASPGATRRAGRIGSRLVHADYRDLRDVLDAARHRARGRRAGGSRACRRCSSTPRAGASASAATSRSTCGWIRAGGRTAADLVNDARRAGAGRRDLPLR